MSFMSIKIESVRQSGFARVSVEQYREYFDVADTRNSAESGVVGEEQGGVAVRRPCILLNAASGIESGKTGCRLGRVATAALANVAP